jgi:hypothetical protein
VNSMGHKKQYDNRLNAAGAIARTPLRERQHYEDAGIARECKVSVITCTVLDAFPKLRKATIRFITSVCLSVRME